MTAKAGTTYMMTNWGLLYKPPVVLYQWPLVCHGWLVGHWMTHRMLTDTLDQQLLALQWCGVTSHGTLASLTRDW